MDRGGMVEQDIVRRGIRDERVLAAMRKVPRERFVAAELASRAYDDAPLPSATGRRSRSRTSSRSWPRRSRSSRSRARARDRHRLGLRGGGARRALRARSTPSSASRARWRAPPSYASQGSATRTSARDAATARSAGPRGAVRRDRVSPRAARTCRRPLLAQLALGGRLVMPVGETSHDQELLRVTRQGPHDYRRESLGAVVFVPLVGAEASGQIVD